MHKELFIAHLDLKPDNFLITDSGDVILIDFDMAEDCSELLKDTLKMTRIYRPPEVLYNKEYDPIKVDIFGIGVCMLMVICRSAPFFRRVTPVDIDYEICLQNRNYIEFAKNPKKNIWLFFMHFGVDLSKVEDTSPYEIIASCLHPKPELRPTID